MRSRELVIPQVLKGVGLTPEVREKLAAGKTVHIKNMTDNEGNLFSAFVRVNHERAKFDFLRAPTTDAMACATLGFSAMITFIYNVLFM